MAVLAVGELARAALGRLGRVAPTAKAARAALESIEQVGTGPPYTIAITGERGARTALLDYLAGDKLFEARRHDPARVVMTMQRGPTTKLRARRRDGSVEEQTLGATASGALVVDEELVVDEVPVPAEASVVEAPIPVEHTLVVRRPPWWAVWRWLLLWIRSWRSGGRIAGEPVEAAAPPRPASPSTPVTKTPVTTVAARVPTDPRASFIDVFRALFADATVERIFLDVERGPLPEKIIVIELPTGADPKVLGATGIDACLVACDGSSLDTTPQLEAILAIVPHVFAVGPKAPATLGDPRIRWLGDASAVAPEIGLIAELERAISVGDRAIAVIGRGRAMLERLVTDAEAGFRTRLDRLEARRIPDLDDLIATELARLRPAIVEHAHRSLRNALKRLDADLARLAASWLAELTQAGSIDALRTAAARVDEGSAAALQAARTETRRVLLDDLTEYTLAQYLEFVSTLRDGTSRTDPLPSWLEIDVSVGDVTTGTNLGAVAPRLTSLFRSLDALKTATLAQLDERIEALRQHATSLFLDSEPRVEPAITGTLAIALHADAKSHCAWLETELARAHGAIEAERAALAPIVKARDAAITDERTLVDSVGALARDLP